MITIALIFLIIANSYVITQLHKHEIAIVELLKKHPDMLIEEDEDDG